MDRIGREILPRLLDHHNKMKERFDYFQNNRFRESLSAINTVLKHIADEINKYPDLEKSVNEQLRSLIPLYLCYAEIDEEQSKTEQERAKQEIQEWMRIDRLIREMDVAVSKLKGKTRSDAMESDPKRPEQAAEADAAQQVQTESSEAHKFRRKVEEKYYRLDGQSKRCLLLLSVFTDNICVKETNLRLWWMEEGLMPDETRAEEFVHEALLKFEKMDLIQREEVKRVKVPPMARGVLNILAERDLFFHIDSKGNVQELKESKIALLLSTQRSSQYEIRNQDPEKFHTLFNVNESLIDMQRVWLSRAKNLRVLQLGSWRESNHHTEVTNTDFLRSFVNLKQLKYLSFRRISGIHELPSYVFSKLQDLRILDLKGCQDLTTVSAEIGMLEHLTHLDTSECYLLLSLPKEIGKLKKLQVLKGLVIWDTEMEFACKISDLKLLTELRKLSNLGTMKPNDRDFAGLSSLIALRSLSVTWISEEGNSTTATGSSLVSLPALEKLDILCYPESNLLPWINLSDMRQLKKLYIRGGQLRYLGAEGAVGKVEVLRLKFLDELALNLEELKHHFPHLKHVEMKECPKLKFKNWH